MRWPTSIRSRLLLISALTVSLALTLTVTLLVSLFSSNIRNRIDAELTSHINTLAGALSFAADGTLQRPESPLDQRFATPYGGLYWQIVDDARGQTVRSLSLFDTALALPMDRHAEGAVHRYLLPGPAGSSLIVLERLVQVAAPEGKRALRIAVAIDAQTLEEARAAFIRDILPAVAGLGVFLVVASILQLTLGLRPLAALNEGIVRIRERRANQLTGAYPSEFQSTVAAVNALLDTQEAMMGKARKRAADLAHGLRTPLTVLSNDVLTLRDKGEAAMADELEHLASVMRNHVERELALARIAASADLRRSDADVAMIVGELVRILKRSPSGERLRFEIDGPNTETVPMDPADFRELICNLLENAVKCATAEIRVRWKRNEDGLRLTISDDGPGVPEQELGNLTRRGWRLDMASPGSGLGLSIVREIVDVYRIGFMLRNRKADSGLEAELLFAHT